MVSTDTQYWFLYIIIKYLHMSSLAMTSSVALRLLFFFNFSAFLVYLPVYSKYASMQNVSKYVLILPVEGAYLVDLHRNTFVDNTLNSLFENFYHPCNIVLLNSFSLLHDVRESRKSIYSEWINKTLTFSVSY